MRIVKLSLARTVHSGPFLICYEEDSGYVVEFTRYDAGVEDISMFPCDGFNSELGFKMKYNPGEVDDYNNEIKLKKEI